MKIKLSLILLLITFCGISLFSQEVSYTCQNDFSTQLEKASNATKYLQRDRHDLTAACMIIAFKTLEKTADVSTIPLLVSYFDFRKPSETSKPMINTHTLTNETYPAVDSVAKLGTNAIPYLKNAITNEDDNNPIIKKNAAMAYVYLSSDRREALRFIMKTVKTASSPQVVSTLTDTARILVNSCPKVDRQECEIIVNGN